MFAGKRVPLAEFESQRRIHYQPAPITHYQSADDAGIFDKLILVECMRVCMLCFDQDQTLREHVCMTTRSVHRRTYFPARQCRQACAHLRGWHLRCLPPRPCSSPDAGQESLSKRLSSRGRYALLKMHALSHVCMLPNACIIPPYTGGSIGLRGCDGRCVGSVQ